MPSEPVGAEQPIRFGEGYELDLHPRKLRLGDHVLKLERIPFEILLLLIEHHDQIVTRDQIVARVWGQGVFLDTDNSVRGAIRKLRQVLKDDAESPRFIQTVTGQGYRFIALVITPKEFSAPSGPEALLVPTGDSNFISEPDGWSQARRPDTVAGTIDGPASRKTNRPLFVGTAAVLCLLSFVAIWSRHRPSNPSTNVQGKIVLAVLPFENLSHDAEQVFFSDGLTEEMIAQVGKLNRDRLSVVARSSIARYKGSNLAAREIGRELNADYLLQGSVRRWSDHVRITVQLIQAQNQTALWTESYDRELKDVLAVQDSVVQSIAYQIHIALSEEQKTRFANPRPTSPEAYVAYLKGRYYWNKRTADGMLKADQYFQQAVDSDPTYAAAYSGLADCNSGLAWHGFRSPAEALPKAYAAARKAVDIDPQSAEAHASLGLVLSHRWDWAEAESEFKRALQLDPQYANAHHWYGDFLSIRGRHVEALTQANRALELDPLNLMIGTWVALRNYQARNYSRAIEQAESSVDLDANFAPAHLVLGESDMQAGSQDEGVNELMRAASLSGGSPLYTAQVAVALAEVGKRREALQIARELETTKGRYVSPYGLAQIYSALNNTDETFKWLQIAYDDRSVWMGYLAVDPVFDRYRSDRGFQLLLRRIDVL